MKPHHTVERVRHFFGTHVWATDLDGKPRSHAFLYRAGRTLSATASGFRDKELTSRAAALTYYSILSIVPFLAFAFSLLKGFGVYHKLITGTLQPYLHATFAGDAVLLQAIDQVLKFVEGTGVSGLSLVGVLFLIYTSVTMLSTVETAMNDIWEARTARPLLRKITDYTTLMVVGPLLILVAIAISTAAQSSAVVTFLHRSFVLGGVVDVMLRLTSLVLGCTALVALYVIMPNARIKFASALFGGVIAGCLWEAALLLHVRFQVGVASYNALYSGFAALPIFLVWLYVSWNIVLIGAQLAASHQYEKRIKQRVRAQHMDQELRETLAIVAATVVSRRFLEGRPPATSTELAATLDLPLPAVEPVLEALVRAGVLVRVVQRSELGYDPGRDLDAVRMVDIENAVRHDPRAEPLKATLEHTIGPELSELLNARRELGVADTGSLTLRQLAAQCDLQVETVSVERPAAARPPALLDGKQPGVPA